MIHKILVPLDGSKLAEKALPYAQSLAEKYDAELILVQAIPPAIVMPIGEFGVLPHDLGPVRDQEAAQAAEYLKGLQERLRSQGLSCRSIVLKDMEVAEAIVDIAKEEAVSVIVKTTHGRSGLSRWVYGSVATKVLQQAPCPVFLIRVQS
jgi:nucleotide-binding universal stress UspA family protein